MSDQYDPNWNPDDYDMTLKYEPMDLSKVNAILSKYKGQPVLDYIIELLLHHLLDILYFISVIEIFIYHYHCIFRHVIFSIKLVPTYTKLGIF
jgi:hypothetical protein